jgi:hypothetical protein
MCTETAIWLAVGVEILTRKNALLLENDVLDHASMALGHQKNIAIFAIGLPTHQVIVEHIRDFGARERRRDVQRADLLRNIEDAAAIAETTPSRRSDVDAVAP